MVSRTCASLFDFSSERSICISPNIVKIAKRIREGENQWNDFGTNNEHEGKRACSRVAGGYEVLPRFRTQLLQFGRWSRLPAFSGFRGYIIKRIRFSCSTNRRPC